MEIHDAPVGIINEFRFDKPQFPGQGLSGFLVGEGAAVAHYAQDTAVVAVRLQKTRRKWMSGVTRAFKQVTRSSARRLLALGARPLCHGHLSRAGGAAPAITAVRQRWTMRWKAPLNAFQIAFEGCLTPSTTRQLTRSVAKLTHLFQ
ncbi:hypothetical protein [Streptomyces iranensis]|uniref:Uncharacterized protein n=1 Tax=Streptomyces iranensis TaxID=576784 RepID=A0A060ZJ38_9ACTN|nr:hypothetical protein [Streptomyces iranensis]CDR01165.1 predicted protein [Streptomyces iranensis]